MRKNREDGYKLDQILGKNRIRGNHPIKHYRQSYLDSNLTWNGQYGGCEGQRQKGWTAILSSLLLYLEHLTKIKGTIIGQGDNQIVVLDYPKIFPSISDTD